MKHTPLNHILLGATALTMPAGLVSPVRADASDPKAIVAELQKAWSEFKSDHDQKLAKKADDVVVSEKLDRINSAMDNFQKIVDDFNTKLAAQAAGGVVGDIPVDLEYTAGFKAYMRKGDIHAAINKGVDSEGGYLAPIEWDRSITGKLKQISPIRSHARVITIQAAGFKRLYTDRSIGSGWVGETAARPETTTPAIASLDFTLGELYANPAITQGALDDAAVDVEGWLGDEVDTEFARQEGVAYLSGDGSNKPYGILTYVTGAANAARHPWGAIQVINSGVAADIKADSFFDLIYDLPSERATNAKLFMNRGTIGVSRKLKDAQGRYIWEPSYQAGEPARIAGEPVVEISGMPAIAAGAIPVLYGDMERTYLIIDRVGIRVLRDPYTKKPFVLFYTTKRVGGGVDNPEWMRALKIAVNP